MEIDFKVKLEQEECKCTNTSKLRDKANAHTIDEIVRLLRDEKFEDDCFKIGVISDYLRIYLDIDVRAE